jgi:hypothetical protein
MLFGLVDGDRVILCGEPLDAAEATPAIEEI